MRYVRKRRQSHFVGPVLKLARFIWKPRKADEAADHIATYNYNKTDSFHSDVSMLGALLSSLYVQDDPHTEHPFHGLITAAKVSSELHNGRVYMSIRSPARGRIEEVSEQKTMEDMSSISHFPFVVDAAYPKDYLALPSLGLAAETLGDWLEETVGQAEEFPAKD
jgi:hypothetical protein